MQHAQQCMLLSVAWTAAVWQISRLSTGNCANTSNTRTACSGIITKAPFSTEQLSQHLQTQLQLETLSILYATSGSPAEF